MYQSRIPEMDVPVAARSVSRILHQRAILDKICQERGISKAQLSKELGISKPAVANNVSELISIGLVEERGVGEASASGGRKPVMLFFNPSYCYISVIDLSLQTPVCVVFDLNSHIICMQKIVMDGEASAEERRQSMRTTLSKALVEAGVPREKLGVIIIAQPGIITDETHTSYLSGRHYPWTELGLKPFLQQHFDVPVIIKNDVGLAAVGEMHFGTNTRLRELLYVSCGLGLGAGIIIGGRLYEGSNNVAGEIGMMQRGGGNNYEDSVAVEGLIAVSERIYAKNGRHEPLTFPLIVERLKEGDALLERAVREIAHKLGRIILNCCVVLDIPTVIFGGEYLELGPILLEGMREVIASSRVARYELIPSTLINSANLYGGSAVGKEKIFSALVGGQK